VVPGLLRIHRVHFSAHRNCFFPAAARERKYISRVSKVAMAIVGKSRKRRNQRNNNLFLCCVLYYYDDFVLYFGDGFIIIILAGV
jgi:hypothetical protein